MNENGENAGDGNLDVEQQVIPDTEGDGKFDVKQRIYEQTKAVQDIEAYLEFCMRDMETNVNFKQKSNKDRLINRLNNWADVLGNQAVTDSCAIIDADCIHLLEEHDGEDLVFVVGSADGFHSTHYISSFSNHCSCDYFKNRVMEANDSYLCEHLIAVRIAKVMGFTPVGDPDLSDEFN